MKVKVQINLSSDEIKAVSYNQDSIKRYIPALEHKLSLVDKIRLTLGGEKSVHIVRDNLLGQTDIKMSVTKKGIKANIEIHYDEGKVVDILVAQQELYENILPIIVSTYKAVNTYTSKYVYDVERITKEKRNGLYSN